MGYRGFAGQGVHTFPGHWQGGHLRSTPVILGSRRCNRQIKEGFEQQQVSKKTIMQGDTPAPAPNTSQDTCGTRTACHLGRVEFALELGAAGRPLCHPARWP
jgi:hypothetical protein